MNTHTDKTQKNKRQVITNSDSKNKSRESTFQFVDNRPGAIAQRKLQAMADHYSTRYKQPIQKKGTKPALPVNIKGDAAPQESLSNQEEPFENDGRSTVPSVTSNGEVLQAVFSQTNPNPQQHTYGGVAAGYVAATNTADLHIAAGANAAGNLMSDFLIVLWEVRDTIAQGEARNPPVAGHVEMHPGGSQVLKMTMEMLGEAVGQQPFVQAAQAAATIRKQVNQPLGQGIAPGQLNDILDSTVVPEHVGYRDSLVGVAGITMAPVGGGTSGGVVDMLHGVNAANERVLYDNALNGLQPFMSLNVSITLPVLDQVIGRLEGNLGFFQRLALKAKYMRLS